MATVWWTISPICTLQSPILIHFLISNPVMGKQQHIPFQQRKLRLILYTRRVITSIMPEVTYSDTQKSFRKCIMTRDWWMDRPGSRQLEHLRESEIKHTPSQQTWRKKGETAYIMRSVTREENLINTFPALEGWRAIRQHGSSRRPGNFSGIRRKQCNISCRCACREPR